MGSEKREKRKKSYGRRIERTPKNISPVSEYMHQEVALERTPLLSFPEGKEKLFFIMYAIVIPSFV